MDSGKQFDPYNVAIQIRSQLRSGSLKSWINNRINNSNYAIEHIVVVKMKKIFG